MRRVSIGLFVLLVTVINYIFVYNYAFKQVRQFEGNEREFKALHGNGLAKNQDGQFDIKMLSHRLIALDREFAAADERAAGQAIVNVNAYLSAVRAKCTTNGSDEGNAAYVACAGNQIGQHFYYFSSTETTSNYAQHRSGSETNTYLMIDATNHLPISASIVFSPGHAFFAWKDSFGEYQYWETTANNNLGELADLQDPLYVKNPDRTYYTPLQGSTIEDVYLAEIYEAATNKPDLERLYQQNFENMRIADVYFDQKSRNFAVPSSDVEMTEHDAHYLRSLLQTDVSSASKRIALARYYLHSGDQKRALKIVDDINPYVCLSDCYAIAVEAGKTTYAVLEPVYRWFDEHSQARGYAPSAGDFLSTVFLFNTFLVLLACWWFIFIRK
ncbi:hypothetical protein [Photorhabdus sp. SF281]|uniref:hypothetical protein n=1 Tax=Photorhabdus sp. SF281 TaxID=3459527 RepID=UPI00404446F3